MFPASRAWLLDRATEVAYERHKGRTWAGGLPYSEHLRRVDVTVYELAKDHVDWMDLLDLRCAAWLHDAVEDTGMLVDEVKAGFGERVASLVWAVTSEPGKNRKERHEKTYPKIKSIKNATVLKLADRIVNVEASLDDRGFLRMYQKEHPDFRRHLYVPGEWEHAWARLEEIVK